MPPLLLRGFGLALALICLCAGSPVQAHAIVLTSVPSIDASVAGPSVPIEVHFNSRIDQARSRLLLISSDGAETVLKLDPASSPDTLTANAGNLAPGAYRLRWLVLAVDGHITRGDIPFKVTAP